MAKRSREPEDSSSSDQDVATAPVSKVVTLDVVVDDSRVPLQQCSLPGHHPGLTFASYEEYESHYNKSHINRCIECRKTYPSSHILELHLTEFHDAFAHLKKDNGDKIYACLVETCHVRCDTPNKRRLHLIKDHHYPENYFFAVTKTGIDNRQSMLVERKPHGHERGNIRSQGRKPGDFGSGMAEETEKTLSLTNSPSGQPDKSVTDGPGPKVGDTDMDDLAGGVSALSFVPRSVRFGPRQEAAFGRR